MMTNDMLDQLRRLRNLLLGEDVRKRLIEICGGGDDCEQTVADAAFDADTAVQCAIAANLRDGDPLVEELDKKARNAEDSIVRALDAEKATAEMIGDIAKAVSGIAGIIPVGT